MMIGLTSTARGLRHDLQAGPAAAAAAELQ
jgi:hypothetical protein